MNNPIEELFNELLLPLTKKKSDTKNEKKGAVIYERGGSDEAATTTYRIQMIQSSPQQATSLFNIPSLLTTLLPEQTKTLLLGLSERINGCKRCITEAAIDQPITEKLFENTLSYIYYISELLPIFANNRLAFSYKTPDTTIIQHTSLVFEYLMTLWGLVSHLYHHIDPDNEVNNNMDADTYRARANSLDFCIHVLREMVAYIGKMTKNELVYRRFIYRASPSSISSKEVIEENRQELEEIQHEKDIALITTYFGGLRGITARLHLFYAKKYEFSVRRALTIIKINDILGSSSSSSSDSSTSTPFVTKENASHMMALAGMAQQICQHYGTACKKIRDDDSITYHYTFHKSVYWQCVANFLRASVDFYQYLQREERIIYGKQALKRAESIKSTIESFNYAYRDKPHLIKALTPLTVRMTAFYESVNYKVKVMSHRDSNGVTLEPIEEATEDESKVQSMFQQQMTLLHQKLCENEESQSVKQSLRILYSLKSVYIGGTNNSSSNPNTTNTTINITTNNTTTSPDDQITMAVLYERYNWLHYLVKKAGPDTNGDNVVILQDVDTLVDDLSKVKRIIQENLLKDTENATSSSLSNKLSSQLYI